MKVIIDIETNALENPTKIWVVVCKNIKSGKIDIFRRLSDDEFERQRFIEYSKRVSTWIGHNIISYDLKHLRKLIDGFPNVPIRQNDDGSLSILDTLVVSKCIDYPRNGHSIESYGLEFGLEKGDFQDWSKYSLEMEKYCIRDVEICHLIYKKYQRYIHNKDRIKSLLTEHQFEEVVDELHENGFYFNRVKAEKMLEKVTSELEKLDKQILEAFKPRLKLIREITPKETKYGTISLSSIPKTLRGSVEDFNVGAPFSYCKWEEFNPASHKQIIEVLNRAGWKPVDKTKTHVDKEREFNILKKNLSSNGLDLRLKSIYTDLERLRKIGWKVNEHNLETLPPNAPSSARLLATRILYESRRRTLTEWLSLLQEDGRIHGRFYAIGAWTHRMAHQKPNTANIPNEFDTQGKKKLLGKEMRSLWSAPKNRLLVGVDAEGIQLRIFAHYINDLDFTKSLINGKKEDKSDPHSLNQSILGDVCKSRAAAKRYIYALLLGAGQSKLQEILDCDETSARKAYERLLARYTGFAELKETIIPADAKRGWFLGLDGRAVRIPGDTLGSRRHLAMSGYLQDGEAVVMKMATLKWVAKLKDYDAKLVNFVHDEWQVECPNDGTIALKIAKMMAESLVLVGQELGLKCPLAGSYWNDDLKDYTIGTNWAQTH